MGPRKASARFWLREASGALGDFGTFVPLAVGMVVMAGLDAGTLLVTAGLANIWGGLAFGIPIAAQPMKAICALAIAGALVVAVDKALSMKRMDSQFVQPQEMMGIGG